MRRIRISIASITFTLIMFGIIMVYSSSAIYAYEIFQDSFFFLRRHLLALFIGFILTFLVMGIDCDFFKRNAKKILFFTICLLLLVFLPGIGRTAGGARRWVYMGFLNFQPSEIAKFTVLIYLADFISRKKGEIRDFVYGFIPPLIVLGTLIFIILLEPDLGTAVTLGTIGLTILFVSGVNMKYLAMSAALSSPLLFYLVFFTSYRKRRLLTFFNPWVEERGAGFQLVQSLLAFGSGGILGVGLGQSKQKLLFLPASHTDFIFSIIGEELGFLGALSLILLFFLLIWQGARAAFKVEDSFKKMLIFGIVFTIAFEFVVNTCVATGLLPTKGMTLPFISYGGTSLVMHMVAIGLLLNATRE